MDPKILAAGLRAFANAIDPANGGQQQQFAGVGVATGVVAVDPAAQYAAQQAAAQQAAAQQAAAQQAAAQQLAQQQAAAAAVQPAPAVSPDQLTALISPHVGNEAIKSALGEAMRAQGINALPEAQPHQYGPLYQAFQGVLARFGIGGNGAAVQQTAPASII